MSNNSGTNVSQLNDLRSYSRHWLMEFIALYQQEECLWLPKHPDYSNHSVRNKAYENLVEKLKEVEPKPDRAMVVRKINSLRSAFRREFRKKSTKANYETRLWYYDKLLFIADQNPKRLASGPIDSQKTPKRSLTLFDDEDSMEYETEDPLDNTNGQVEAHAGEAEAVSVNTITTGDCVTLVKTEEHTQHAHAAAAAAAQQQPQHTTAVKVLEITSLDSNSQQQIQQAVNSLEQQHQMQQHLQQQQNGQATAAQLAQIHQQVPTIQISREHLQPLFGNATYSTATTTHRQDDEYDAIGINVASKLRVMNPTQRIIAEKLISDILFNGQLDNLSINSTLTQ